MQSQMNVVFTEHGPKWQSLKLMWSQMNKS